MSNKRQNTLSDSQDPADPRFKRIVATQYSLCRDQWMIGLRAQIERYSNLFSCDSFFSEDEWNAMSPERREVEWAALREKAIAATDRARAKKYPA